MTARKVTLETLQAFDCLEVGPVTLTSNRLTANYRLFWDSQSQDFDLVYKYEEDVFSDNDSSVQNMANMIGVQIAFNYGLFCKEIVFRGEFSDIDQRFIRDMTENTSREIYVKKLQEFNPYFKQEFSDIEFEKRKKYTLARLSFPDSNEHGSAHWELWSTEKNRYAILSSGGKDSLLTYGLLNELAEESRARVFPIFVNESGRHWFTALNSYRFFNETIPDTRRVWTNSDRLFNWMLRCMPFIKDNYKSIRFDEYAIRLWTVAVFIFGALPLLRKHGISRLVIGDEYDTTVRSRFKGLTHYNGLYDQSLYFDNALSRYFLRKGWSISQFSILRPLSEILIEKILVKRYPDLQAHQVSCHAASEENGRIVPCGKCEKCRRIVGMLLALGSDPRNCGYKDDQIKNCLASLVSKGVHQESAGAEQMMFMLKKRGLIENTAEGSSKAMIHNEVMKLRFDHERSPMNSIPGEIRKALYKIYLKYVDGAVVRSGRSWNPIDVFNIPDIMKPYPFDLNDNTPQLSGTSMDASTGDHHIWSSLRWPETQERLKTVDLALLPVGSIEQHGPHLPLDTDAFDADYLARKVAQACSDPKPFVLPLISYGVSYEHDDFPGTISISNQTLTNLVYEIGMSLARQGIKKLIIINGHGGNGPALNLAAQKINCDARIFVCVDSGETSDADISEFMEAPNDIHAGEIETSTSLAVRPESVHMDKVEKLVPEFSSHYLDFTSKRGVSWYSYTNRFSSSGVIGDPTVASPEKGKKIWKMMIAHLVALVEDVKNLSLEEIYQRKY